MKTRNCPAQACITAQHYSKKSHRATMKGTIAEKRTTDDLLVDPIEQEQYIRVADMGNLRPKFVRYVFRVPSWSARKGSTRIRRRRTEDGRSLEALLQLNLLLWERKV